MAETFQTQRQVEFRDTDAAGIVHFSVFFAFMEEAEHAMLRELGLSVHSQIDGKTVSWPRVAAKCEYQKAIKFEQVVTISVTVERIGTKSVTYQHVFTNSENETVAKGSITAVCCELPNKIDPTIAMKPISIEIPDNFVQKLKPYLMKFNEG